MSTEIVLNKRGTSIRIHNGRYHIRNRDHEWFVPTHLVRTILLNPSTSLSYEVVLTAIENQTEIIFQDKKAFPIARIWSNKFGSINTIRRNQLTFTRGEEGLKWIKEVIRKKIENQGLILEALAVQRMQFFDPTKLQNLIPKIDQITELPLDLAMERLRGLEGMAGKFYFSQISRLIPERYTFTKRSKHPARDSFNALLNYAYGMLYSTCETALIKAGIDPYIGIMHADEYNKPVFVYDFIELYRHWADYVVIHLCCQEVIEDDFFLIQNGEYRLDDFGKRILIQSFNDYLHEIIELDGLQRSRRIHIEITAQKLANHLKTNA